MFAEYQRQVLLTYHQKKAANTLSFNLAHSTPAKLRAECVDVFVARYNKKDHRMLQSFFGTHDDEAGFIHAIRKFDIDKFRPLDKFLKNNNVRPDEKNIELLAWLLEFQPRPWQWDYDYVAAAISRVEITPEDLPAGEPPGVAKKEPDSGLQAAQEKPEERENEIPVATVPVALSNTAPARGVSRRILITAFILLALSGAGIYWAFIIILSNEKCMCWTGDHYQRVSCKQRPGENPVYALDSLKLGNFKKITTPDTLTANAVGRVWYSKIDGKIEYFTASGFHPIHTEKRLHPLTVYMLNKYHH